MWKKRILAFVLCLCMIVPGNLPMVFAEDAVAGEGIGDTSALPACDCGSISEVLYQHGDGCTLKKYYIQIAENAENVEGLYAIFTTLESNGQQCILDYLNAVNYYGHAKEGWYDELVAKLNGGNGESGGSLSESVDGKTIIVSGEFSDSAVLSVNEGDAQKENFVRNHWLNFESDDVVSCSSYSYDIDMSEYTGSTTISISNIPVAGNNEQIGVWHLLDSTEAIETAVAKGTAEVYVSENDISSIFPKETAASNDNYKIYYEVIIAERDANNCVVFTTDSFSEFIVYTVDFHYNGITYSIPGGSGILLSELFTILDINRNVTDVSGVTFTNYDLVAVDQEGTDWRLTSLQAFTTTELLTISFTNGEVIEITVTDEYCYKDEGVTGTDEYYIFRDSNNNPYAGTSHITARYGRQNAFTYDATVSVTLDARDMYGNYSSRISSDTCSHFRRFTDSGETDVGIVGTNRWYYVEAGNNMELKTESGQDNSHFKAMCQATSNIGLRFYEYNLNICANNYCTITQSCSNVTTLDIHNRTVTLYVQNVDGSYTPTTWSSVDFPSRTGTSLSVSNIATGYKLNSSKSSIGSQSSDGASYSIYLDRTTHTVTWKNGDGTVIETDTGVRYGATPTYNGSTPTKTATAQYTYTWNGGWSPTVSSVTGDVTYTATFGSTVNKYTVTWKNEDGTVLETDLNVPYETTPTYNGQEPQKASTAEYSYKWKGWSPTISEVTGNVTYTATFDKTKRTYEIIWLDGNGDVLKIEDVEYGDTPSYTGTTPTKKATLEYSYTFNNTWSPSITTVTGEKTYTAQFDSKRIMYDVVFTINDEIYTTMQLGYGDSITAPEYNAPVGYEFSGWSVDNTMPANNVTYDAIQTEISYTITYNTNGGSAILPQEYSITTDVTLAEAPTLTNYNFTGWKLETQTNNWAAKTYNAGENIGTGKYGDITLVAQWDIDSYTVTATIDNGGTINGAASPYKETVEYNKKSAEVVLTAANGYKISSITKDGTPLSFEDGITSYTFESQTITADVTLAMTTTEIVYGITYNLNGGSVEGTNPATYIVTDSTITLINPTKAGYTFAGWTGTDLNAASTSVSIAKGSTGDREYTATWTMITYNITYNLDGGTEPSPANPTEYTIESSKITLREPIRQYYKFLGWEGTDLTGIVKEVEIPAGSIGDRSYTAKWEKDVASYTIKYYFEKVEGGYEQTTEEYPDVLVENVRIDTAITEWQMLENITGFTYKETKTTQTPVVVLADNAMIIEHYYDRNTYDITWNLEYPDGTVKTHETQTDVKYGAAVMEPAVSITHYEFSDDWTVIASSSGSEVPDTVPGTVPAYDMTIQGTLTFNGGSLTITKSGMSAGKSTVFTVSGDNLAKPITVTIEGEGSVTLNYLPTGTYTVTEEAWSWEYTCSTQDTQPVTIAKGQVSNIAFTNAKTNSGWLSGEARANNKFPAVK